MNASKANSARERFEGISAELCRDPLVLRKTTKGFAAGGLFCGGKLIGVPRGEELLLKLPAKRVAELLHAGLARPFTGSGGRVMREWALVSEAGDWDALLREALAKWR